ncbi:BnaC02g25880D [Brassica napus]|uniref:BnaC02g25880D protein n=1 Tax=Brassica napus TaxID=3708 RepID=A0A078GA77_BRANA|nr:BnaC02g25880D [Brassica napus]
MLDGVILSDSKLLVEGEDLEDWEQGEIMDFAEEEGIDADDIGLGEAETEQKLVALYDEKVAKKKEMKQEAGMTGGAKKRVGQAFVSPRKKLLAKAGAKQGDKAKKGPPKP